MSVPVWIKAEEEEEKADYTRESIEEEEEEEEKEEVVVVPCENRGDPLNTQHAQHRPVQ